MSAQTPRGGLKGRDREWSIQPSSFPSLVAPQHVLAG